MPKKQNLFTRFKTWWKTSNWNRIETILDRYALLTRHIEGFKVINIWDSEKLEMYTGTGIVPEQYVCIKGEKKVLISVENRLILLDNEGIHTLDTKSILKNGSSLWMNTPKTLLDEDYVIIEDNGHKILKKLSMPLAKTVFLSDELLNDLVHGKEVSPKDSSIPHDATHRYIQFITKARGKALLNTVNGNWIQGVDRVEVSHIVWNKDLRSYCLFSPESIQLIKEDYHGNISFDYPISCEGFTPSKIDILDNNNMVIISEGCSFVLYSKRGAEFHPNAVIGNKRFDFIGFYEYDTVLHLICGGNHSGFNLETQELETIPDFQGLECPNFKDCKNCRNCKIEPKKQTELAN